MNLKLAMLSLALLLPVTSFAGNDLVGKWATPCTQANPQGTASVLTHNEFKADLSLVSQNFVFANATCSGALVRQDAIIATYAVNGNTIQLNANHQGHAFEIVGNFSISGDTLTIVPTKTTVDGQAAPSAPAAIMKRM
jgi:hypothetical protein